MKNLFLALFLSLSSLLSAQAPDTIIAQIQLIKNTSGIYEVFYGKDMRFSDTQIFRILLSSSLFQFDTIKPEEPKPKISKL